VPVTPLRDSDPAQVGPHRLLGRLGQGGMGTVFLGVSPDDRAVAVKVLRDGLVDPDARRRFRHELEALRRVGGPHLVEVLDADVDADLPYLVTRFVPGKRLDDLVHRSGPLELPALRQAARGLAEALTALHGAGVVHRDLTPGNVLMLDGQPHVIDLGLAVAADVTAMTRSGMVIGTPGYLAPEQVTGSLVTSAIDVHAWGATVAFAATGRPPYGTGRPEAVLYRIVHGEPDLEGVPAELADLVHAAMHPDPEQRPLASSLLAALGGATHAESVTVTLSRDVDATMVLRTADLRPDPTRTLVAPVRELVGATSGPHATPPRPPYDRVHTAYDEPDDAVPDDDTTEDLTDDGRGLDELGLDDRGALAPLPTRTHPARAAQVGVTGAAALAVVVAATLVAPVLGVTGALLLLVGLRTVSRSSRRLHDRRERRGERRRDPLVTTLGAPWHLVLALADTLTSLPLILLAAAGPAAAVWFADPVVSGLERDELTIATATLIGLVVALTRRVHARSRLLLRRTLLTVTPGTSSAVAVAVSLAVIALLLLATAEGRAPTYWPLQP